MHCTLPWGYDGATFTVEVLSTAPETEEEVVATLRLLDRGTVPEGEEFAKVGDVFAMVVNREHIKEKE